MEMLNYASMDSYYLFSLAKVLRKRLRTCARLDWVEEECEILSNVRHENNNHNPFFFKFKGARKLDSKSLYLLEAILQFRDKNAKGRDVPHFKILGNKSIDWTSLGISFSITILIFVTGILYFNRMEKSFADVI